jgi:hypothetical protein
MADETPTPPASPTKQGYAWKVLDVLFAKDGRRSYDTGRVKVIIALFALVEVFIRVVVPLGVHLIDRQFDAYSQAMTRVQTTEVQERRDGTDRTVKALDKVGEKIDSVGGKIDSEKTSIQDLASTIREAWLKRGGVQLKKKGSTP